MGEAGEQVLIRVEDLGRTYRSGSSELVVFSGLNVEIARGERLAVIGESGAGKSTSPESPFSLRLTF